MVSTLNTLSADPRFPLVLFLTTLVLAWAGVFQLVRADMRSRELTWLAAFGEPIVTNLPWYARLDLRFRRTRPGAWLEGQLRAGGVRIPPLQFVTMVAVIALAVRLLSAVLLPSPVPGTLGMLTVLVAVVYLRRRKIKRQLAFTVQVADVARVLANFTSAGLSLPTAAAAAAEELPEPAASEMRLVGQALAVGHGVEGALGELSKRMPSRELSVLAGTINVLSRSGGDTAHAMRTISHTLESRREVLDEIQTTLSMSKANAWGVVILGIGSVLIIRFMAPDALTLLLTTPIGLLATSVAVFLFVSGYLLLRRATKINI